MDPNERLTGIASLPPGGGMTPGGGMPSRGGMTSRGGMPPGGMPPRGGMPPGGMGGPSTGMSGPPTGMGERAVAGAPPIEEDPGMNIEQDSAMLAEAVVGRAQGDVGAAIAVLDTAKAMLISSVEQPPMDGGMGEPPMQAAYGGPLYRQGGGGLSFGDVLSPTEIAETGFDPRASAVVNENVSDVLRQMIMDNLQEGRAPSDRDVAFHTEILRKALGQGQTGRTLSDKDLASHLDMIGQGQTGRESSDRDRSRGFSPTRNRALSRMMRHRRS